MGWRDEGADWFGRNVITLHWLHKLFLLVLQEDDARLLLGAHCHGFGNWEKKRLDEKLGLTKKIAPVELRHHETFLPSSPAERSSFPTSRNGTMISYFIRFITSCKTFSISFR